MVNYVYYGWNLRYEREMNIRFGTMEVMDDLDNSSVRGVVMVKSLLEHAEERIEEIEVMTRDNSFKLFLLGSAAEKWDSKWKGIRAKVRYFVRLQFL